MGGLFRHVRDVVRGQAELGHEVGIFCDSATGGEAGNAMLEATAPYCALGVTRVSISKFPGLGDLATARHVGTLAKNLNVNIIHGHGAKGGLYGRLAGKLAGIPSVYTPHGGSLHYEWSKFPGPVYLATERALSHAGSGFIFVCEFEKQLFAKKIGLAGRPSVVVHNGLWPDEFTAPKLTKDVTDLLFVGEMRKLKGVDILLQALAVLRKNAPITLTLVGDGPDQLEFESLAKQLNLGTAARFVGRHNIGTAMTMGKMMILPSRHESFPYVVLETVAAGVPIIASDVGGIAEVLPTQMLCRPDDSEELAIKISGKLKHPVETKKAATLLVKSLGKGLLVATMVSKINDFYQTLAPR